MFLEGRNMIEKINELKGKIINSISDYFSKNTLFLTYVVLGVLIGFFLRLYTVGDIWAFKPFLCDLTVVVIIGSFGYLIKPKNQVIYYFSLLTFYTFLGVVNSLYYMFYSSFVYINLIGLSSEKIRICYVYLAESYRHQ